MISRSLKAALIGCGGLLVMLLSGCTSNSVAQKPVVQPAVAGQVGNTYIIRPAAVRTPGSDRLQQAQRQLPHETDQRYAASVKQSVGRQPVTHTAANHTDAAVVWKQTQQSAQQQRVTEILRQQEQQRARYHARYQAKLVAEKRQAARQQQAQLAAKERQQVRRGNINKAPAQKSPPPVRLAQQQHGNRQPLQRNARVAQQPVAKIDNQAAKRQFYLARWEQQQAEKRLEAKKAEQKVERVISNARQHIGRKYVWGGASPKTGFDCSGLVQHSIKEGANVKVPRTAAEQYRAAVKVPEHQASRGDLVFFKTRGNSVSHVGIYLGDNRFIHAPRTGRRITKSNLTGYWKERFVGFGRIPGACKVPVV